MYNAHARSCESVVSVVQTANAKSCRRLAFCQCHCTCQRLLAVFFLPVFAHANRRWQSIPPVFSMSKVEWCSIVHVVQTAHDCLPSQLSSTVIILTQSTIATAISGSCKSNCDLSTNHGCQCQQNLQKPIKGVLYPMV